MFDSFATMIRMWIGSAIDIQLPSAWSSPFWSQPNNTPVGYIVSEYFCHCFVSLPRRSDRLLGMLFLRFCEHQFIFFPVWIRYQRNSNHPTKPTRIVTVGLPTPIVSAPCCRFLCGTTRSPFVLDIPIDQELPDDELGRRNKDIVRFRHSSSWEWVSSLLF